MTPRVESHYPADLVTAFAGVYPITSRFPFWYHKYVVHAVDSAFILLFPLSQVLSPYSPAPTPLYSLPPTHSLAACTGLNLRIRSHASSSQEIDHI